MQSHLALVALLLISVSSLTTARIGWRPPVEPTLATPNALSTFLGTVRSIFGRASEFLRRLGFNYEDVYNDQLMFTTLNAFENEQRVQETKQGELLTKDLDADHTNFVVICSLLSLITAATVLTLALRLHDFYYAKAERRRRRTIKDYNR